MKCSNCAAENVAGIRRCVSCGKDLIMDDQNRPTVSMDGLITPAKPSQASTPTHQPTTMQVIPRHRSAKGFLGLRKSPAVQAVSLIVVVLLIGGAYSILNGGKSTSTSIPDESVPQTADSSIDFAAPTNDLVSGVNILNSIVQITVGDGIQDCWGGTGSVFLDDHHVLTNNHIVESDDECDIKEIYVETVARIDEAPVRTHKAVVVATDEEADLAILEISPITTFSRKLVPVKVAETLKIGAPITAIGFPAIGGSSVTVTTGEISGFSNYRGVQWIKSSSSISGGNSGGGAFDSVGGLVGVPTFMGAQGAEKTTDCRAETDTNGDGQIDEDDQCVSMGGFINSLSPGSRALDLARTNNLDSGP